MSELKTKKNDASVEAFIDQIPDANRRADGVALLEMFERITGENAKMWGSSIVGFGQYHYKSERSSQEGDWPLVGFSPRKQNLSLYVLTDFSDMSPLLSKLGKHKTGRGCLYINKLTDVETPVLEKIIAQSFNDSAKHLL